MGVQAASHVFLTVLALIAGTQANSLYVFDFENDLQGWESLRGSWRWADQSTLDTTIPSDYKGGFAIMDDLYDSDELYTPYFRVPRGGNFTMKFYLRSRYIHSNDLLVYTRDKQNVVKDFIDLKSYSLDDTTYWSITQKELPPESDEVRFEIFCYNGEIAAPGQPLLGCAIDQIAFDVYNDNTTPDLTSTTPYETSTTPVPISTTPESTSTTEIATTPPYSTDTPSTLTDSTTPPYSTDTSSTLTDSTTPPYITDTSSTLTDSTTPPYITDTPSTLTDSTTPPYITDTSPIMTDTTTPP